MSRANEEIKSGKSTCTLPCIFLFIYRAKPATSKALCAFEVRMAHCRAYISQRVLLFPWMRRLPRSVRKSVSFFERLLVVAMLEDCFLFSAPRRHFVFRGWFFSADFVWVETFLGPESKNPRERLIFSTVSGVKRGESRWKLVKFSASHRKKVLRGRQKEKSSGKGRKKV